jgi:hypothetical protein
MASTIKCKKCQPVFHSHDMGWDVFRKSQCYVDPHSGKMIPAWYDYPIVEDFPTRAAAVIEFNEYHPWGVCLVRH